MRTPRLSGIRTNELANQIYTLYLAKFKKYVLAWNLQMCSNARGIIEAK
jgi:hypothetical protein